MKKMVVIGIISMFLLTSTISVSAESAFVQKENFVSASGSNELIIKGSELKAYEYDVKEYGDNCVRLSEGGIRGTAYYLLSVGDICNVSEGMQIGIEYKDVSLWGSGPSVYIYDFDRGLENQKEGWFCILDNIGKTENFKWEWRESSNSDKYVLEDMGLIFIKVVADTDDDTIIRNMGIRYDFDKEPLFNYDPYIGYASVKPSKAVFKPNPNFDGQPQVTLPRNGTEGNLFCAIFQILKEAPNTLLQEEWRCYIGSLGGYISSLTIVEDCSTDIDNTGVYLMISTNRFTRSGWWWLFRYGSASADFYILVDYRRWIDPGFLLAERLFEDRIYGRMRFRVENQKPMAPTIEGPTHLKPGEKGNFILNSTDPDGDQVQFRFDCDFELEWSSSVASGTPYTASRSWNSIGTHTIRVMARDTYFGGEPYYSDWSEPFTFKVSRSKPVTISAFNNIIIRLSDRFPLLKQFLR